MTRCDPDGGDWLTQSSLRSDERSTSPDSVFQIPGFGVPLQRITHLPQIQAETARLSTGAVEQVDLGFTTEESVLLSDGVLACPGCWQLLGRQTKCRAVSRAVDNKAAAPHVRGRAPKGMRIARSRQPVAVAPAGPVARRRMAATVTITDQRAA